MIGWKPASYLAIMSILLIVVVFDRSCDAHGQSQSHGVNPSILKLLTDSLYTTRRPIKPWSCVSLRSDSNVWCPQSKNSPVPLELENKSIDWDGWVPLPRLLKPPNNNRP